MNGLNKFLEEFPKGGRSVWKVGGLQGGQWAALLGSSICRPLAAPHSLL